MSLPSDYLERVYAGVLGKLIGVYLGRPFEQWTHARIMAELGPIKYYVHDRLNVPLVVTDDDVAGTFTFIRALEDYGVSPTLSAEDIGNAWLNYCIEQRSILWWGGNGNSTEHTAWLNLQKGIPAPLSGSIAANGVAMAEQIGAQIFVDGWALVSPCRPELAVSLAQKAASVSHDGEAVYAAMIWAAMEAAAFSCSDVNQLLNTGLKFIPKDSQLIELIGDVRSWHRQYSNWLDTRQAIEDHYGYDKYPGNCHVIPNHALMIMALLYAPDNFHLAQTIINTAGWDTDCNAGNLGCLQGIMLGLPGLDDGPDWRGPLADRMLVSSADGGSAINDAVRVSYYLAGLGHQLAGREAPPPPKRGSQFHFALPGSRQGFQSATSPCHVPVVVGNHPFEQSRALSLDFVGLAAGQSARVTTPTFASTDVYKMEWYELMATPLIYPGQTLQARVSADGANTGAINIALCVRVYDGHNELRDFIGDTSEVLPGDSITLSWRLPEFDGQPIGEVGLVIASDIPINTGRILVDFVRWDGAPHFTLKRPAGTGDFWRRSWVNGVSVFSKHYPQSFRISQDRGEGILIHGTRQWSDYQVECELSIHLGEYGGLAIRVQGLRRYYAARLTKRGAFQLVRVRDGSTVILAEVNVKFHLEQKFTFRIAAEGNRIFASIDSVTIEAIDNANEKLRNGGIGLVVFDGALSTDAVTIKPIYVD